VRPLSAIVIDAHLATWERRLRDPDGPLLAMRSTASAIADLLPPDAAKAIRQLTGNQELTVIDEHMRPVANPVLTKITRAVPADTAYQISHVAERLAFTDYSDILAEVTNAVVRKASHTSHAAPPQIAKRSFPHTPLTAKNDTEPTTSSPRKSGNHPGKGSRGHPPMWRLSAR
jgi:hypothetical protein